MPAHHHDIPAYENLSPGLKAGLMIVLLAVVLMDQHWDWIVAEIEGQTPTEAERMELLAQATRRTAEATAGLNHASY